MYDCAEGELGTALSTCMKGTGINSHISTAVSTTNSRASSGEVDPVNYLASHKVYMYSGTADTTVYPAVMDALETYYESFIDSSQIYFEDKIDSAHTQPTTDAQMNKCTVSKSPYISYCNYDGAGEAFKQIYGDLNPRNNGTLSSSVQSFSQDNYLSNPNSKSIADTGYIYIPEACSLGESCRLHVAFHGCLQDYGNVGNAYIENAGYNYWADSNNIVVLYPQTIASSFNPSNANACWNWWGYNNNPQTYDTKSGYQMNMVYEMILQLTSGAITIASPTNLATENVTSSSVTLVWDSVSGATGYDILRNGQKLNNAPITDLSYVDNTVQSGYIYVYSVEALQNSTSSAPSNMVVVHISGTPPPLTSPTNLVVSSTTNTSVSLVWTRVADAGYNIYRNGNQVNDGTVYLNVYTDKGLQSSTSYEYYVTAVRQGDESGQSNTVTAETDSSYVCTTYTSSNYDHVTAGRAYQDLGECYAVGSNDDMGLYNTFTTTTLAETSEDYYIVGNCPTN